MATSSIGQKAKNLRILSERFPALVPQFYIVEMKDVFVGWKNISKRLNQLANQYIKKSITKSQYEKELATRLQERCMKKSTLSNLEKLLKNAGFKKVSYRTSAFHEDLSQDSFAGQYLTFLDKDIDVNTIKFCVLQCAKSLFSQQVLAYVQAKGYTSFLQNGSVIIQKMFYGELSGVLFTENGHNQLEVAYTKSWRNTAVEGNNTHNFSVDKQVTNIARDIISTVPKTIQKVIEAYFF